MSPHDYSSDRLPCLLSSPHFPYTTLFRSAAVGVRQHPEDLQRQGPPARLPPRIRPRRSAAVEGAWGVSRTADEITGWLVDRKSTRLNSSHLVISYAVFCLKKKHAVVTYHH